MSIVFFIIVVAVIAAVMYVNSRKNSSKKSDRYENDDEPSSVSTKGPYSELVSDMSMQSIYARFFGAVSSFQEKNGEGSVIIRKNDDGETILFNAHYCNHEYMDCSSRIRTELLFYDGLYIIGSGDQFSYTLEKVKCPDSDFGIDVIISELKTSLPEAIITDKLVQDNLCSVQFRT